MVVDFILSVLTKINLNNDDFEKWFISKASEKKKRKSFQTNPNTPNLEIEYDLYTKTVDL